MFACMVTLLLTATLAVADPAALYVAPDGDDASVGTANAPFATLQRGRDELRALRAADDFAGATVNVRPGTYELTGPLVLGPEDSGTPIAPVVWRGDGQPVLAGALKVTGFAPHEGPVLRADLTGTPLEGVAFRQLIFGGERMTMARYPNFDPDDPHGGEWAHILAVPGAVNRRRFTATDDVDLDWASVPQARVCIHGGYDWAWSVVGVQSVDPETSEIVVAKDTAYDLRIGDRYYIQNVLEMLDAPGEWYLDSDASVLYFWPPADLATGDVLASVTDTVLQIEGASNIAVRGFTIEACDGNAVIVRDSESCSVEASVIRNCGGWGVAISGGHNSGAVGNDIYETGRGGVSVDGGDRKTLESGGNFATNNYIHHIARFWHTYNPGVSCRGVGNLVSHNLIHDTPHAGLTLGGNENVVELNEVHHTNLQSADTGGIYFCSRDWTQRGNIIRHNVFHHVGGFGKARNWASLPDGRVPYEYPSFTWGIYLDDPTTGTLVYGNILYSVPIRGLHNHGGRDNTFENNIIIDCPALRAGRLSPTWSNWPAIIDKLHSAVYEGSPYLRLYPELADYGDDHPEEMSGIKFVRNIVYFTEEGTRWLRELNATRWQGGQELYSLTIRRDDWDTFEWDNNVIYAPEGMELRVTHQQDGDSPRVLTWDEWRAQGVDEHSLLADPLFVDAANRDYRLRPDSPALKLGFKQIPIDQIGLFAHDLRASWPVVEAPGASRLGDFTTNRHFQLPGYEPVPAEPFATRDGAPRFFAKLRAGGPVSVAYFGGGIHPTSGWRALALDALRERYPDAEITEIDAGICDCCRGSSFSVHRFAHDVLAKKPDLVLVDFASDDHNRDAPTVLRAMEGIIRQARAADPDLDVIFLHAFRQGFEQSYADGLCPSTVAACERLADHYGVPSVNMGHRIAQMLAAGEMLVKPPAEGNAPEGALLFSSDGVRPSAAGNTAYAASIAEALDALADVGEPAAHPMPTPLANDNLQRATQIPITAAMLEGDWQQTPPTVGSRSFPRQFDHLWVTRTPGAKPTVDRCA